MGGGGCGIEIENKYIIKKIKRGKRRRRKEGSREGGKGRMEGGTGGSVSIWSM